MIMLIIYKTCFFCIMFDLILYVYIAELIIFLLSELFNFLLIFWSIIDLYDTQRVHKYLENNG